MVPRVPGTGGSEGSGFEGFRVWGLGFRRTSASSTELQSVGGLAG